MNPTAPETLQPRSQTLRPIKHLRWYIGGLLFLSTVINYIDRQTLSVLAPTLKTQFNWTNTDYSYVIIAFRLRRLPAFRGVAEDTSQISSTLNSLLPYSRPKVPLSTSLSAYK